MWFWRGETVSFASYRDSFVPPVYGMLVYLVRYEVASLVSK